MSVPLSINGIAELDFPTGVSSVSVTQEKATVNIDNQLALDDDVLISSPTDGQVLTYEIATTKWKNKPAGTGSSFNGVNAQSGTSYTFLNSDNLKLVTFNNAASVAVTLPQAGSGGDFNSTFVMWVENLGAGLVTITPTTSTIDGNATLSLSTNQGCSIWSNGTQYFTSRGTTAGNGVAGIVIGSGASVPTTGSKGFLQVPYSGTILSWTLIADQSGSAQITVKKSTYAGFPTTTSIVASAPPNLVTQQKNTSSTLTGWTTAITAGDVLEFNLDSVTTCQRLVLELTIRKS